MAEDTRFISLESQQKATLNFVFSKQEGGTYVVSVEGVMKTFKVHIPSPTGSCPTCG